MTTKYISKEGWHFQYIVDDGKPFYRALAQYQGAAVSSTPLVDNPRWGEGGGDSGVKTIFPGSDITSEDALY